MSKLREFTWLGLTATYDDSESELMREMTAKLERRETTQSELEVLHTLKGLFGGRFLAPVETDEDVYAVGPEAQWDESPRARVVARAEESGPRTLPECRSPAYCRTSGCLQAELGRARCTVADELRSEPAAQRQLFT